MTFKKKKKEKKHGNGVSVMFADINAFLELAALFACLPEV
jgi:hypothetical protein